MKILTTVMLIAILFSGCGFTYITVTGNNNSVTVVSDEATIDEPVQGIYGEAVNSLLDNDEQNTKQLKLGW